jgi:hypothetical protein
MEFFNNTLVNRRDTLNFKPLLFYVFCALHKHCVGIYLIFQRSKAAARVRKSQAILVIITQMFRICNLNIEHETKHLHITQQRHEGSFLPASAFAAPVKNGAFKRPTTAQKTIFCAVSREGASFAPGGVCRDSGNTAQKICLLRGTKKRAKARASERRRGRRAEITGMKRAVYRRRAETARF